VKLEIQNDEFVRTLQSKVIKPMLDFQENHNKRVEALLRKMFSIKYTKDPKTGAAVPLKMEFTKSYLSGGIDSVNTIGKEARALLLDYYQKSEGYYILGVKLFEQYNSRTYWSAVA
jgi:hypothetical protein